MHKNNFISIARIIYDHTELDDTTGESIIRRTEFLDSLVKYFINENPRFDVTVFLDHCLGSK